MIFKKLWLLQKSNQPSPSRPWHPWNEDWCQTARGGEGERGVKEGGREGGLEHQPSFSLNTCKFFFFCNGDMEVLQIFNEQFFLSHVIPY